MNFYWLSVRCMQKTCDVCEQMADKFLKDQIIFDVRDDSVREKLLQERQLTLPKTIDMCRAAESASVQAKDMATASPTEVNRVTGIESTATGNGRADELPHTMRRKSVVSVVNGPP